MHSPLSSPSLRTITHLPRGSYFPAHIPVSASPRQSQSQSQSQTSIVHSSPRQTQGNIVHASPRQSQSNTVHASPKPGIASPLNGCLKHSGGHIPTSPILHPGLERRRTTRTSAVPPSPSVGAVKGLHHHRHASVDTATENARRRPSFKIDLPPRPVPLDIHHQQQQQHVVPHDLQHPQQQCLPHPHQQQQQHQQQHRPQKQSEQYHLQQQQQQHQYQQGGLNPSRPGSTPFAERPPQVPILNSHTNTLFRDPFATNFNTNSNPSSNPNPNTDTNTNTSSYPYSAQNQKGYIILQAAPAMISPGQTEYLHHPETGSEHEHDTYETLVGLGYSLNKLRAPTPWIRGHAEDAEWLNEDDVSDIREVEGRLKGVSIA